MTTSLETLQYHLISSIQDWDIQYQGFLELVKNQRVDVVALTQTPRNIGQINISILWFLPPHPAYSFENFTYKRFTSTGSLKEAVTEATAYLEEWVPPHRLVSVSCFEDDHPALNKIFHVVVYLRGRDNRSNKGVLTQEGVTS